MWWALIEEIAPRAEEMAGENEMACCVRGYHLYKDIWAAAIGKVLVCRHWCVIDRKIFNVKIIFCVKYFRTFSVYENIFTTEKSGLLFTESLLRTPYLSPILYSSTSLMRLWAP